MCDYSLHAFPNRLAVEGEDLVVHRFGGGSLGLASAADVCSAAKPQAFARRGSAWSWRNIQSWFLANTRPARPTAAVCIPPGATLVLRDIPRGLQRELGVGESEEVTFVETTANVNVYRDAVRFKNQTQVLLQALQEGQRVRVVSLDLAEEMPAPARREHAVLL
jgi:hypothetical protein